MRTTPGEGTRVAAVMVAYNRRDPPRRSAFVADLLLRTLASRRLDQGGR